MPFLYRKMYPMAHYNADFTMTDVEGRVPWISVDPDFPDLKQYPLFEHANPIHVTLQKGDVLYLPSLWFHQVKQSPDELGRAIAVNFWFH
jgi:peptidyl-lysine (3S)-dioxygenase / protease